MLPGARDVVLRTDDGLELGAWYAPARGPDRTGPWRRGARGPWQRRQPGLVSVARVHYPLPPGQMLRDRYPVTEQIRSTPVPTIVV
ncbi:MAG: hypothetical protein ACRDRR_04030 [Pseudonocardiaceae bacterium]